MNASTSIENEEESSEYQNSEINQNRRDGRDYNEETAAEYAALNGMSPGGRPFDENEYVARDSRQNVVALVISLSMKVVGILLVGALMVIPVAASICLIRFIPFSYQLNI